MASSFCTGALVVLGPGAVLVPLDGVTGQQSGEAQDFGTVLGQLLERGGDDQWTVCTFEGVRVRAKEDILRLLTAEDLEARGVDLVLGPGSSFPDIVKQIPEILLEKGFALLQTTMSASQRQEVLDIVVGLDEDELLSRLPTPFEPGYLGRGGKAKVAHLENLVDEMPAELLGMALPMQERIFTRLCDILAPYLEKACGFTVHNRTNLMLRLPFVDAADEDRYLPPEVDSKEADHFLSIMGRKRLCILQCLGPQASELRLIPKAPELSDMTLSIPANGLVLFLTDSYDYEYQSSGVSLTLQSFLLAEPLVFEYKTSGALELTPEDLSPATGPGLPAGEPVSVVGMASRDPCYVDSHEKLWTAIRHGGCDGFLEIPHTRFDVDLYVQYDDQVAAVQAGKSYCRHQGHVEGIEIFDAAFFNVPQQECYGMDPEQRFVLETGWLALSEAGYDRKKVQKDSAHIGVFVGISGSDWSDVCQMPSANGIPETFIANRFSYLINLKGPSFISNTACSASLVAMHSAKVHMLFPVDPLNGALVCGVSLNTAPGVWAGNCSGNMLSFKGRSFSFNGTADGYGRGEGCAAAVIKPIDYDPTDPTTHALLAGTQTNSDGRSASLTAPNGPAQQRLLRSILTETQIEAQEVCVYEAHGTGTSLGDPIEVGAVKKVIVRDHPIFLSCSKTNLGHLEGGAGMSSFCKCVMACMHTECASNNHLNVLNPHLDITGWPAFLLTEAAPMKGNTTYVGVSGFGYGGTNSHAMTYGRNVVTSRGEANPEHIQTSVMRKVKAAPAPDIIMEGDSYENWISTGAQHLDRNRGKNYRVELLEDGKVQWSEVVVPDLSQVDSFQIQGTFTSWQLLSLEPSEEEPGLWCFEVELGASGEELFQIAVEHDPYMVLYPEVPRCTRKAAAILGPGDPPSREHAWLIRGTAGKRYRVEFFQSGATTAVMWRKCASDSAVPEPETMAGEPEALPVLLLGDDEIQE